jgi:hypothetical protein
LHSKVEFVSVEVKLNDALVLAVLAGGADVIDVSGGVVSPAVTRSK